MNLTHEQALELAAGFVLGALEPEEEQAVRDHLATCPESHAEFEELGSVAGTLAETVDPKEPPASLKGRVMAAAAADLEARRAAGATARPVAGTSAGPAAGIEPPPSIQFPSPEEREGRAAERAERIRGDHVTERTSAGTSMGRWLLRAAAVLAIVALGVWNVTLQRDLSNRDRDLAAARDYQAGVAAVLDVANDSGATAAILAPTEPGRPNGIVAIGPDGRVAVVLRDLAATTGTEVYEAWVILGDDAPVPIGSFTPGPSGTATFISGQTAAVAGATVALTREPAPGATTPTAPILSVGETGSPEG
jgi:anti-sigma-K factor RskA